MSYWSGCKLENNQTCLKRCITSAFRRNSQLMLIISLVFSAFVYFTIHVVILISIISPSWIDSLLNYATEVYPSDMPEPQTQGFLIFIFANNVGYYWNPPKLLVWIPIFGTWILGVSFLLNGLIIGVVTVLTGLKHGPLFPIAGLVPHGIIEIPAFIIQWTAILRWHTTITNLLFNSIRGKKIDVKKVKQDLIEVLTLSIISILLLFIAALIETYITPQLLQLVK